MAESWSQPDINTVIVKISQGVHWHDKAPMNGRELDAYDVEYSFHRVTGTGSGFTEPSAFAWVLKNFKWESITAPDKWTVVFKLQETRLDALGTILFDVAGQIYPSDVIREHGDVSDWRNVVGTGPFELADYLEGTVVTYTRNPDYWGYDEKYPDNRLPYVDEVRAPIMPEEATRVAALRSGKVDFLGWASVLRSVDPRLRGGGGRLGADAARSV
ncbi:MAG: ABC transporter substrate-binding protein [Spirochaetaceae bacterium]|nr:ABC transporter substrate-binding protein [Spirochaetaceae bacterium]